MFIKLLIIAVICFLGAYINQVIPTNWNYFFGYCVGLIVSMACMLRYN